MDPVFSQGFQPRSDLAVILACDANYLPYAATPALQMARARTGDAWPDILIGGPEPADLPPGLVAAGIGHVAARDEDLIAALPLDPRRSIAAYMSVFLASAMRGIYRRILVLDADILYERGDLARLMLAELGDHAVAAVRDNRQWRSPARRVNEFRKLGEPAHPYFNSGVLMIDTEGFAQRDLPAQVADFARAHLAGLGRDQALMNGVLKGDWAEMSPLWNWQFTRASAHLTAMADPCFLHFIGPLKPWKAVSQGVVPMRMRQAFSDVLSAHFPDVPQVEAPDVRVWPSAGDLRKALFRQWRAAGPMLHYLERFADEYTLLEPREG